ncbi:hypothetical protein ACEWPM_002135 [Roseovarius sp. S4756]|uniref:hypothetical protein n=1 Tax=Roseovarius maritimus TaxID=3342637 RepID=UPI0037283B02
MSAGIAQLGWLFVLNVTPSLSAKPRVPPKYIINEVIALREGGSYGSDARILPGVPNRSGRTCQPICNVSPVGTPKDRIHHPDARQSRAKGKRT